MALDLESLEAAAAGTASVPAGTGAPPAFPTPPGQQTAGGNLVWYNASQNAIKIQPDSPGTGWRLIDATYSPSGMSASQAQTYWEQNMPSTSMGGNNWSLNLYQYMSDALATLSDHYGMPRDDWQNTLDMNWLPFTLYLDDTIWRQAMNTVEGVPGERPGVTMSARPDLFEYHTQTPQGFHALRIIAQMYFGRFDDRIMQGFAKGYGNGGARGSGSGAAAPSFDIAYLTQEAQNIWRGLLLDENPDIRIIAKAYIDQVTANPTQALDFGTFVRNRALSTPRAKSIYRNKPEGMSEENYIMQYYQAAMQISGPHNAEGIAIGGAQMQADPYAYQARLQRTAEYQSSSGFINGLEERLRTLSGVLGG